LRGTKQSREKERWIASFLAMTWYRHYLSFGATIPARNDVVPSAFFKPLAGFKTNCKGVGYRHYFSFGGIIPAINDECHVRIGRQQGFERFWAGAM
jgi:hypothetical protein